MISHQSRTSTQSICQGQLKGGMFPRKCSTQFPRNQHFRRPEKCRPETVSTTSTTHSKACLSKDLGSFCLSVLRFSSERAGSVNSIDGREGREIPFWFRNKTVLTMSLGVWRSLQVCRAARTTLRHPSTGQGSVHSGCCLDAQMQVYQFNNYWVLNQYWLMTEFSNKLDQVDTTYSRPTSSCVCPTCKLDWLKQEKNPPCTKPIPSLAVWEFLTSLQALFPWSQHLSK